jgi:hypothetical protein
VRLTKVVTLRQVDAEFSQQLEGFAVLYPLRDRQLIETPRDTHDCLDEVLIDGVVTRSRTNETSIFRYLIENL